jgi:hypothetical protein
MTDLQPDGADAREPSVDEVAVGWYPDPTRSRKPRERLWDGTGWTRWTRALDDARVEELPAGWYHDPGDSTVERLWTGSQWTDHRRPAEFELEQAEEVEDDDLEGPSPLRPTFGVPGWYPDEGRPGVQRYWDGEDWTYDAREAPAAPSPPPAPPPPLSTPPVPVPSNDDAAETVAEEAAAVGREPAPTPPPDASSADAVSQLTELARLRDAGALTDEEFAAAKSKVLRRI